MVHAVVLGAQFGDEGKGKIVDVICPEYDIVVRFQGGNNAGHTVVVGENTYKFHLLPSGIIQNKPCVLGNGVVIDPEVLVKELENLPAGVDKSNLFISDQAHVILNDHKERDQKNHQEKIGTTGRGIGPCYADKISRTGIRMSDIHKHPELSSFVHKLQSHITNTADFLHRAVRQNKKLLFEGAQGALLDVDHGTYPFVTSSNTTVGAANTGSGIGVSINRRIGIVKAYTTRVGHGPFVTELEDEMGELLRKNGHEFGTTTGRPRRCGWMDVVVVRQSNRSNYYTEIALTKLDVLSGLDTLKICVGYDVDGRQYAYFPTQLELVEKAKPVYIEMPGWSEDITSSREFSELPINAQNYVKKIEELVEVKISFVSVGPKRTELIRL